MQIQNADELLTLAIDPSVGGKDETQKVQQEQQTHSGIGRHGLIIEGHKSAFTFHISS